MMPTWLLVLASLNLYIIDAHDQLGGCQKLLQKYQKLNTKIQMLCVHKDDHSRLVKRAIKAAKLK